MTVRGKELEAANKPPYFAKMAEHFQNHIQQGDWLAAYVVAFSFLEDRVGALYAERCRVDSEVEARTSLKKKVNALEQAGDVEAELANRCRAKVQERNDLLHNAMWNLDGFTQEAAQQVERAARDMNNARERQARAFGSSTATR